MNWMTIPLLWHQDASRHTLRMIFLSVRGICKTKLHKTRGKDPTSENATSWQERYGQTCVSMPVGLLGCIFLTSLNALCGVDAPAHCSKHQQWPTWTEGSFDPAPCPGGKVRQKAERIISDSTQHTKHKLTTPVHFIIEIRKAPKWHAKLCKIVRWNTSRNQPV